jgi:hypothetical protein
VELKEQIYRREGQQWRPLSEAAGSQCRGYSLGLQRAVVDFAADVSFEQAGAKLREHYGIEVPVSTIRALTQRHAEAMREQQVVLERLPRGGVKQLIGELDGTMVPTVSIAAKEDGEEAGDGRKRRQVQWNEARLGLVREPDKVRARYGVTMGGPAEAGALLVDSVIRGGGGRATKIHGVGDGAPWIAKQFEQRLGSQASYLIDFYHVSEYLAAAAEVVAGADKQAWLREQQARLKTNQVEAVLRALRKYQMSHPERRPRPAGEEAEPPDPVQACRQYLENRRGYLDYAGALAAGLPLGSGEVESAHRSVIQARLKIPGAWWKVATAENMLALRALRANQEWESYWHEARQSAA